MGFSHTDRREVAAYSLPLPDPGIRRIQPGIFQTWDASEQERFAVLVEDLSGLQMRNQEAHPEAWQAPHLQAVLQDLAGFHAAYLGRTEVLNPEIGGERQDARQIRRMRPLWKALWAHHRTEFPDLLDAEAYALILLDQSGDTWARLEAAPGSLIHNDCNPRNLCLRETDIGYQLVLYDWELARCHVPQHDMVEFLAFALPADSRPEVREDWARWYREALIQVSGKAWPEADFLEVFRAAAQDFTFNRLGLYLMAHAFKDYGFRPGVLKGMLRYVGSFT